MEVQVAPHGKKIIDRIDRNDLENLCHEYNIKALKLFGSILTNNFNPSSDIDILIEFSGEYIPGLFTLAEIERKLSNIFHYKVDLRTKEELSKYFRNDVLQNIVKIYG